MRISTQTLLIIFSLMVILFTAPTIYREYLHSENRPFSVAETTFANDLAKQWIYSNQLENGFFVYDRDPFSGASSRNNNTIRQLMASRLVAQEAQTDAELLPLHKRNLDAVFRDWYREEAGIGYILFDDKSKLGANAMLLRSLIFSPNFVEYSSEARALYNGILALQDEQGEFRAFYQEPSYQFDEQYLLTFYSGEALLAMVEYYEITEDPEVLRQTELSADFYLNRYVEEIEQHYFPAYVPWHTLAYNKLYQITGEQKYVDGIFTLNDKLIDEMLDTKGANTGRFFNPAFRQYGTPHSSSDGVYTEGVVYALEIALLVNDREHIEKYVAALELAVPHLISLQYQLPQSAFAEPPELYLGAFRINDQNPRFRVDNAQHTVDAFTKILEIWPQLPEDLR